MPDAVQALAAATPLGHAVTLVRPLVVGAQVPDTAAHLGVLAAHAAGGWVGAEQITRRRVQR